MNAPASKAGQPAPVSAATIRRLWLDRSMLLTEVSRITGLHRVTLMRRARALGLPPRPQWRAKASIPDADLYTVMWADGLSARHIATYFGVSYDTAVVTAKRLGLARRPAGFRPISFSEWQDVQFARRLAASAAETNAAMRLSGRA